MKTNEYTKLINYLIKAKSKRRKLVNPKQYNSDDIVFNLSLTNLYFFIKLTPM